MVPVSVSTTFLGSQDAVTQNSEPLSKVVVAGPQVVRLLSGVTWVRAVTKFSTILTGGE